MKCCEFRSTFDSTRSDKRTQILSDNESFLFSPDCCFWSVEHWLIRTVLQKYDFLKNRLRARHFSDMDHQALLVEFREDDNGLFKKLFAYSDTNKDRVLDRSDFDQVEG